MALGTPTYRGATGTTTATTASFTPAADSVLIAFVATRRNTSVPVAQTIADSLGGSWTEIGLVTKDLATNPRIRITAFVQGIGSSPSAMTVTGTCTDGATTHIALYEVTGASATVTNYASDTNATGDPAPVLPSAPASTSGVIGVFLGSGGSSMTQPTGWTETHDTGAGWGGGYDITSPGDTHAWTTGLSQAAALIVEVAEAGGAGNDSVTPSGISVATSVGTPALTQDHAVAPTGISSTTHVGAPALTQDHAVAPTGISVTTHVGAPALTAGTDYALNPTGISVATSVGAPALTQDHAVAPTGISVTTHVGAPAVTTGGIDYPVTPLGLVVLTDTTQSRTVLTTLESSFDNASWTKTGVTVSANADGVADRITAGSGVTRHDLVLAAGSNATNGVSHRFVGKFRYENHAWIQVIFGSAAFGSNAYVNVDIQNLTVGGTGSAITATRVQDIGSGYVQIEAWAPATATAGAVAAWAMVAGTGSARLDSADLTGKTVLAKEVYIDRVNLAGPALTHDYVFTPTGIASATHVGAPALTQNHAVSPTGISVATHVGSPALTIGNDAVVPSGIVVLTHVGAPALTQNHAIAPADIVAATYTGVLEILLSWAPVSDTPSVWTPEDDTAGVWTPQTDTASAWTPQ